MEYHLQPPFFVIAPQASFDDAWEVFCCELLNLEHATHVIRRRIPPDLGADLIWESEGIIYQCKATEGALNLNDIKTSIDTAKKYQGQIGWHRYILCTNVDLTGKQEQNLREYLPCIEFLSRSYWVELCKKFPDQIADRFCIPVPISQTTLLRYSPSLNKPFLAPPLPHYHLIGHDDLFRDLKLRLIGGKGNVAISALNGLPGVGKTALALALAHDPEILEHFSDGVLWAGLGREADALTVLGMWGIALGIGPGEIEKLTTLRARQQGIRARIGLRRMLLIIDDAWQVESALALQLGGPSCAHLVTTRLSEVAISFAGEASTTIHELDETDSLALLAQFASQVIETELNESRELVQAVGGLPLALMLIGKYLQVEIHSRQPRRLRRALDRLNKVEERLRLEQQAGLESYPSLPAGTPVSLIAVIRVSDEALNETARMTLRALSVFPPKPNTFAEEAALVVSASPTEVLDILIDFGLLESNGHDRYTLHQTIADYARAHLTDMASYERLVDFFIQFVEANAQNYKVLEPETKNILTALQQAFEREMSSSLLRGVCAISHFLLIQGLYAEVNVQLERARQAASFLGDTDSSARVLLNLGRVAERRGEYAQAETYFQEGLEISSKAGKAKVICALFQGLGVVAMHKGNGILAEEYFQRGLTLARQVGDQEEICTLLQSLGGTAIHRGDHKRAEAFAQEGLDLASKIGYHYVRCGLLQILGAAAVNRGDYLIAKASWQEALTLAYQVGDLDVTSSLYQNLGMATEKLGNYAEAIMYYQEGLTCARQFGQQNMISALLHGLGMVELQRRNYIQAGTYLQDSLTRARELEYHDMIIGTLSGLGIVGARTGNYAQAKVCLQEGLDLARRSGSPINICDLLQRLGEVAIYCEDYEQAETYLREAWELARQIDHPEIISSLFTNMGDLAVGKGDSAQATTYWEEGLKLARSIGHRERISILLTKLGAASLHRGDMVHAEKCWQEGLEIADQMEDHEKMAGLLMNLGQVALLRADHEHAEAYFQRSLALARSAGHPGPVSLLLKFLGIAAASRKDYEEAEKYWQEGLGLARQIDHQLLIGEFLYHLGMLHLEQQQLDKASEFFQESMKAAQEINPELVAHILYGLARIALVQSNKNEALRRGEESLTLFKTISSGKAAEVKQWLDMLAAEDHTGAKPGEEASNEQRM